MQNLRFKALGPVYHLPKGGGFLYVCPNCHISSTIKVEGTGLFSLTGCQACGWPKAAGGGSSEPTEDPSMGGGGDVSEHVVPKAEG